MREFIRRNYPVIILGFIIVVIFLIIITYSENASREANLPSLLRVEREELTPEEPDKTEEYFENPDARPIIDVGENKEFVGTELGGYLVTEDGTLKTEEEIYEEEFQKRVEYYKGEYKPDTVEEIDAIYPTFEIIFTSDGFVPKTKNIVQGQRIMWSNGTEETITIKQNTDKYDDAFWKDGIKLGPGESFEYRVTKPGYWSYREEKTNKMGSVFAAQPRSY